MSSRAERPETHPTWLMTDIFILVCINKRQGSAQPSCAARGGVEILEALQAGVGGSKLAVETCYCFGRCADGPVVRIGPGGPMHLGVTVADVPKLLDEARRFARSREQP